MDSIKKLADLLSEFPGVGRRTASRFVFYLLKLPSSKITELTQAIQELKNKIRLCSFCFQPFEDETGKKLCTICSNPARNKTMLCIVEKETDLLSLENTKRYTGFYFILGGTIGAMHSSTPHNLRIEELKERMKNPSRFGVASEGFAELIIATNPTPEGTATGALVERSLKEITLPHSFKTTHLAKGLPVGGELEYADDETLESAFEGRK